MAGICTVSVRSVHHDERPNSKISPRITWLLAGTLLYYFLMAFLYIQMTPLFEASDEAEHFLYVHHILTEQELPTITAREDVSQSQDATRLWNNHTHHAPLYYLSSAVLISWSERTQLGSYLQPNDNLFVRGIYDQNHNKWLHDPHIPHDDTPLAVYALRLMNTLIGGVTLLLIYLTVYVAWQSKSIALLGMFITVNIPTYISVHTSITNDALLILFSTAGMLWLVKRWQERQITKQHIVLITLIVAGASLTKLTGLTLAGVVGVGLLVGLWQKRFSWRDVIYTSTAMLLGLLIFVGWWYLRNWQLYGDPFALTATQSIWGREFDTPIDQLNFIDELVRLWRSFWLMIGYRHQPIMATDTTLFYATALAIASVVGAIYAGLRHSMQWIVGLFIINIGIVFFVLLVGTRNVDISYGRLLYPALSSFVALIALGLYRLPHPVWRGVAILPLLFFAITTTLQILRAYPPLQINPTDDVTNLLRLESLSTNETLVNLGQTITFDVTFTGNHPDNPSLLLTLVDSITQDEVARLDVYPATLPTSSLKANTRYQTKLHFPTPSATVYSEQVRSPRLLDIYARWTYEDAEAKRFGHLLYVDPRYTAPLPRNEVSISFSDIHLVGYESSRFNDTLDIALWWIPQRLMDDDWTLTLQLLDADGQLVTQSDGMMAGYPTSYWQPMNLISDNRQLSLPENLASGTYQLWVGWYRLSDLARMPSSHPKAQNNLVLLDSIDIP
jgi:hypothetical protein